MRRHFAAATLTALLIAAPIAAPVPLASATADPPPPTDSHTPCTDTSTEPECVLPQVLAELAQTTQSLQVCTTDRIAAVSAQTRAQAKIRKQAKQIRKLKRQLRALKRSR